MSELADKQHELEDKIDEDAAEREKQLQIARDHIRRINIILAERKPPCTPR